MTEPIPTMRRSRLALAAIVAALIAAAFCLWIVYGRAARIRGVRHVVLVSIDTCRADRLSAYGFGRPTTPHIDAVAREGVLFEQALTPVPLTTPAHASLFTGDYPPTHGVRLNNGVALAESNVTLAEVLRGAGFRTAAFVGGFPLDAKLGLNQGFETYDGRFTRRSELTSSVDERTAEEVAVPAMAWLEQNAGSPFFLFLHFYDPHAPYAPPPPFDTTFAEDRYAGEIAYVDSWIGRVLERLRALHLDDDTLLVITADHGESLGEHGESSHGFFVYQSTQHVPLVLRAPGAGKGQRVAERVNLIDVMPTILDLTGVPSPSHLEGTSLRRAMEGARGPDRPRAFYSESLVATQFQCAPLIGLVEGGWKYLLAPRPELFDLTKDPGEQRNVVDSEPPIAARLRNRLEQMRHELESSAGERGAAAPDPEALARLQALGYVGGGAASSTAVAEPGAEDPKDFIPTYERLARANSLYRAHRSGEAEQELNEILAERPGLLNAEEQLAKIAYRERRPADAVKHCERIVAILSEPKAQGDLAAAHFNLAFALREVGREDEAVAHYEKALSIKPDYVDAHNSLGLVLARRGKLDAAIAHFEEALRIQPDHAQAHNNLGGAFEQKGQLRKAVEQYAQAIKIKPDYAGALGRLAWIEATSGAPELRNGAEAVQLAERACALSHRSVASHLDALAAAYAETGRFDDAATTAEEAASVASGTGELALAAEIASRLSGYRARRPYRAVGR